MVAVVVWKSLAVGGVCLVGCAFAPGDPGPPEPSISNRMRNFADSQQRACRAWPYSEKCTEERRHLEQLAMQQRTQHTVERAADTQAAATREATGKAMLGDGSNTGRGWWCYSGSYGAGKRFGRCLRNIEACADQLVARVEDGMKPDESRCEQRESAVCFSTVETASGQLGNYCFPDDRVCGHFEERKRDSAPTMAVTSCTPYA